MSRQIGFTKSTLLLVCYLLNLCLLLSVLCAAFFLAQGLFGEYYACNEKTDAYIEELYHGGDTGYCLVLLNYTVSGVDNPDMPFTLHQFVQMPCSTVLTYPDMDALGTATSICYNRFNPMVFAPLASLDGGLDAMYTHDDAVRDLHTGYRSALWTFLFAFMTTALSKHMDSIEARCERFAKSFWQLCCQSRSGGMNLLQEMQERYQQWQRSRRRESDENVPPGPVSEHELQEIRTQEEPSA